jgi:exonuclease SbcC
MKIDVIKLHGFTTFRDPAELNLSSLGPGLIAIAGPNGAGKSTLLESIPGAVYRQAPSRGNIADLATSRESTIEVVGENGDPFRILLSADSQNGKSEALLFDGAGEPIAGPKVRDFDRVIAERFPPLSVYLAAAFSCQTGAGSLMKMERAERRELFGRLLGTDHLEDLAGASRERARQVETELAGIRTALAAVKEGSIEAGELEILLGEAKERATQAAETLTKTQEELTLAAAERDRLAAGQIEAQRAEKAVLEARGRAARLNGEAQAVDRDLGALDAILDEAAAIRRQAAEIVALTEELEKLRVRGEAAGEEERNAVNLATNVERQVAAAEKARDEAARTLELTEKKIEEAKRQLDSAEKSTGTVPCVGAIADNVRAGCSALVGHFRIRDEARRIISASKSSSPGLQSAVLSTSTALEKAQKDEHAACWKAGEAAQAADSLRVEYKRLFRRVTDLRAQDRTSQLDRAEAEAGALRSRLKAVMVQAAEAKAAADRAAAECPKIDEKRIRAALRAVQLGESDHKAAMAADQKARLDVARAEAQLEAAKAAEAKAAELISRISPLEQDLADWRYLARGLGREGVQALELDAAGPRVSELTNELLADAYSSRFQVRLDTQAAKADGKGIKETFDIVVVDNERGREGSGEDLSGGEKVIVGEALGLAVGLFHAQAAGISLGTVVRDETVGALDPENGERYLSMLRSFLRVGRVHQLLFVAHQPALVDLADAVVRVEDGRIEVRQ